MQTEFELKFLNISPDEIRQKCSAIWASCVIPLRRMQRYVFAHPHNANAYIRIRQEWNKVTTSYKEHDDANTIESVKEVETEIDNLEAMRTIYKACGLREKAIQETYRENRKYEDVDISIDRRPWLNPFIEIEWKDKDSVERVSILLWFSPEEWLWGTVSDIYHKELWIPHHIINEMPIITFDNAPQRYTLQQ